MANIEGLGRPQIVNRAFVPLAVEAGIITTLRSIVGLAKTDRQMIIALVEALEDDNPQLAASINTQTLYALLQYIDTIGIAPVVKGDNIPVLLNEDGPEVVSAGRDGADSTQINIGFSEPPEGYTAEIYLDSVYIKDSNQAAVDGTVFDILEGVTASDHNIRVLFRNASGSLTRFGPIAVIDAEGD